MLGADGSIQRRAGEWMPSAPMRMSPSAVLPSAKRARTDVGVSSIDTRRAPKVNGMPAATTPSRITWCSHPRRTMTLPRSGSRAGPFGTSPSTRPVPLRITMRGARCASRQQALAQTELLEHSEAVGRDVEEETVDTGRARGGRLEDLDVPPRAGEEEGRGGTGDAGADDERARGAR